MACTKISQGVLQNARSLEDIYVSLGVLKPSGDGDAGTAAPAPRTFLPEGMSRNLFPYLTGNDGRSFNFGPLFGKNREEYNCALTSLGYDEERADKLAQEAEALDGQAYDDFVKNLSASDSLNLNIRNTLNVVVYLRGEGNTDRNADIVSAEEIENWAWKRTNHDQASFAKFGGDAIARLHAFMGIAQYMASQPIQETPIVLDAGVSDAGIVDARVPDANAVDARVQDANVVASDARVDSGPRVTSEVPNDAGPVDDIFSGGVKPRPHESDDHGSSWILKALGIFTGGTVFGSLITRLFSNRSSTAPEPTPAPAVRPAAVAEQKPATPAPAASAEKKEGPKPPPLPSTKPVEIEMGDVLAALQDVKKSEIPAPTGNTGVFSTAVTPENVIIEGANAQPIHGLDAAVVRNQIALHYRGFLSQAARDALQDNKPLPAGAELINSKFEREVSEITDRVVAEYYARASAEGGRKFFETLWENQKGDHHYVVRRGVPQQFLREIANAYIEAQKDVASSPLSGGEGMNLRDEATRGAGEVEFIKSGLRELMRHVGR